MGFFGLDKSISPTSPPKGASLEFLHRHGCKACPLYRQPGLKHPDMAPTGSERPLVYMLGEAPGADEDAKGVQFVGKAGRFLHSFIPPHWEKDLRWNNCVRTRPPGNREPEFTEIECCRPSVAADIEASKPLAIFGFGNVPLAWAMNESGITKWNGKKIPVKIGQHSCWFFPMMHPSYVMRMREGNAELEFVFSLNLRNAFEQVHSLPEPIVHSRADALANTECYTGKKSSDLDRVVDFIKSLWNEKIVGLDYETNRLRPYGKNAKILTVALATAERSVAFALNHRQSAWSAEERSTVNSWFERFLYEAPCRKIAHNLAFEMEWSAIEYGRDVLRASKWGDSMSQAYLLDARPYTQSLEFLCLQHFGINIKEISSLDRDRLDEEELEQVLSYNAVDAKYHRGLYLSQLREIKRVGLQDVYAHHIRRVPTVVLTQIKGLPIDQDIVADFEQKYKSQIDAIEEEMFALEVVRKFKSTTGRTFNPGSNPDVALLVKSLLGVRLAKGADKEALAEVKHPFAKILLHWREANKALSVYVISVKRGSPNLYPDGLIHPVINTTRVRTWRTSSDGPNIQNWPKHTAEKVVRKQVRPGIDERVVAFDFAGIQARNVAMESKDKNLVKAFWNRYDMHSDWMERLAKIYPEWIEEGVGALKDKSIRKIYRQRAKNEFVFATLFGAGPPTLSAGLEVPENIAAKLLEQFWNEFPEVKNWHNALRNFYRKNGYVTGLSGFRRHAPVKPNELINTPIQSDESIIVLGAMNRLSELGEDRLQPNIEIHDDLSYVWHVDEIDRNIDDVLKQMLVIEFPWINTPLEVEVSIGPDWYDLKEIGKFESIEGGGYREIK